MNKDSYSFATVDLDLPDSKPKDCGLSMKLSERVYRGEKLIRLDVKHQQGEWWGVKYV